MKKFFYILLGVFLCGCTFDNVKDFNPDLSLMFQPEMFMHISDDNVDRFPTNQTFGVKAWVLPVGLSWEDNIANAEEFVETTEACSNEVFITDTTLRETIKDTLWTLPEPILWPTIFENLTFIAYSPYIDGVECGKEKGVSFKMDINESQTDILYTAPHADKHKINNGWIVPLYFEHALCKVNFRVKHRVADTEKITVHKITINNIHYKGEFNSLPYPKWFLDNEQCEMNFFEGEYVVFKEPEGLGLSKYIIPQKLDTKVTVIFSYTTASGTTITQELLTLPLRTELKCGYNYTYTLSIGIDDVKFLKELIVD